MRKANEAEAAEEAVESLQKQLEHSEHMRGLTVHVATRDRGPTVLVTDPPAEWTVADLQARCHYCYQAMLL